MSEYIFRPKARLVSTIGADIIKDNYAAVIELVKNAYDADAPSVIISFEKISTGNKDLKITIEDTGHGMSMGDVIDKWLVPATDDKLINQKSPKGRKRQGRKGIGRFAAAVLGDELNLTTRKGDKQVLVSLNWKLFSDSKYLDEVKVPVLEKDEKSTTGTTFEILSSNLEEWKDENIEMLIKELRKTLTPLVKEEEVKDKFSITLNVSSEISTTHAGEHPIRPYPILDMYTYRVIGEVKRGTIKYIFENNVEDVEDVVEEIRLTDISHICGDMAFDFRIFDRDPERIDLIIKNETFKENFGEKPASKNDIKTLINQICGVHIYRDGFRIRPYGDEGYDWLSLDKRRVQDPSIRLGSDQLFGVVEIQVEEISKLVDKSARDGLKENENYKNLKNILVAIIKNIETARRSYRKTSGIGVKKSKIVSIESRFRELVSNENISVEVGKNLKHISNEDKKKLDDIFVADSENKEKIAEEIQKEIAVYHGQATLGKILNVIMHEANKPLSWFVNTSDSMSAFIDHYKKTRKKNILIESLNKRRHTMSKRNI